MAEYIKRKTVVNNLELLARHEDRFRQSVILGIVETIRTMEAADVAPVVHGRWIPHDRVFGDDFLVCSKCQFVSEDRSTRRYYHYCPNCGAKMDGVV